MFPLRAVAVVASLCCILVVGCASDEDAELEGKPARPNIVFFIVDDLRHDTLGATGHPFFRSPQIDRLAEEGARFDEMFVISSLCSPSRATMMTGLYTHEHGVRNIWTELSPSEPTIAGMLRGAGYETAWIGKWHLNAAGDPHPDFDHWVSFPAHGHYVDPFLNVDGRVITTDGHMTDILTRRALQFMRLPRDRPFFLALSHPAVHQPYVPQARFDGLYAGAPVELPVTWDDGNLHKPSYLGCRAIEETDEQLRSLIRDYFDLLAGVDESLGMVLTQLEQLEILDDTVVILVGDNGYLLGEHGALDKRTAYEPSMRVPLLVRYPRWFDPGQRVSDAMALNLDLPVTILEAAGVEIPESMRGHSLRALADGEVARDDFVYHFYRDPESSLTPDIRALRTHDLKYITHPGSFEPEELYDLRADPDEAVNLAVDPEWADEMNDMRSRLAEARAEIGDHGGGVAGRREDQPWVARVFVEVRDAKSTEPVRGATLEVTSDDPLAAGTVRTGPDGRWYTCAKTLDSALQFRLTSVSAPGFETAGPFTTVTLEAGANEYTKLVRLRKAPQ